MKTLAAALLLLLALNVPMHAGENGSKTREQWIAFVGKDAKLSALVTVLGVPDYKKSLDDSDGSGVRYEWRGKCDIGTTRPSALIVLAILYKGELTVWALGDPLSGESPYVFPWADKVRGVAGR